MRAFGPWAPPSSVMTVDAAPLREPPLGSTFPAYAVPGWRHRFGLVAGITGKGEGFDLGLNGADPVRDVMGRWRALRDGLPGFAAVAQGHQVHGTTVHTHAPFRGWLRLDDTDGHVTGAIGVLLTVTVADCIPVFLAVPRSGAVALLHAGWRGASGGILRNGVEALAELAKAPADQIVMHCGVGICGSCYEVGSEVLEAFGFRGDGPGPWAIDLRERLADQGRKLGLGQVTMSAWCSRHDGDRFFSHRGGDSGRMVAFLGKPAPG